MGGQGGLQACYRGLRLIPLYLLILHIGVLSVGKVDLKSSVLLGIFIGWNYVKSFSATLLSGELY